MSRADKTTTRCTFEIDLDPETRLPRSIQMTVLTGVKGDDGKTAKGDRAFKDGVEHVAFHFNYTIDTQSELASFDIPKEARKLMR